MDPLSITISCISLVTSITKVSLSLNGFVRQVRDARGDLDAVGRELWSLKTVLEILAEEGEKGNKWPQSLERQIKGILSNCGGVVEQIQKELDQFSGGGLGKGVKWTIGGRDGMMKLRGSLEAHKSALDIALDMVNLSMAREIKSDTAELLSDTAAIKDDTSQILAEIARLQARLPQDGLGNGNGFTLQRYLDNLSSYAESSAAMSDRESEGSESRDEEKQLEDIAEYGSDRYSPQSASNQAALAYLETVNVYQRQPSVSSSQTAIETNPLQAQDPAFNAPQSYLSHREVVRNRQLRTERQQIEQLEQRPEELQQQSDSTSSKPQVAGQKRRAPPPAPPKRLGQKVTAGIISTKALSSHLPDLDSATNNQEKAEFESPDRAILPSSSPSPKKSPADLRNQGALVEQPPILPNAPSSINIVDKPPTRMISRKPVANSTWKPPPALKTSMKENVNEKREDQKALFSTNTRLSSGQRVESQSDQNSNSSTFKKAENVKKENPLEDNLQTDMESSGKKNKTETLRSIDDTNTALSNLQVTNSVEGTRSNISNDLRDSSTKSVSPDQSLFQGIQTLKLRDSIEILKMKTFPENLLSGFFDRVGPYPYSVGNSLQNYAHVKASSSFEFLPRGHLIDLAKDFLERPEPKEKDMPDDLMNEVGVLQESRLPLSWLELFWAKGRSNTGPCSFDDDQAVPSTGNASLNRKPNSPRIKNPPLPPPPNRRYHLQARPLAGEEFSVRITTTENDFSWNGGYIKSTLSLWLKAYSPEKISHRLVSVIPERYAFDVRLGSLEMLQKAIRQLDGAEATINDGIIRYGPKSFTDYKRSVVKPKSSSTFGNLFRKISGK